MTANPWPTLRRRKRSAIEQRYARGSNHCVAIHSRHVPRLTSVNGSITRSYRLYQVVAQFAEIDLHPRRVDKITMGLVFEDLVRRFNESANGTAGDRFTPREVIQLMVNLLLEPDTDVLTQAGIIVTICDPACGTGGVLAEAQNWIHAHNEQATVKFSGQDYNLLTKVASTGSTTRGTRTTS